jgi:hypothetical protein
MRFRSLLDVALATVALVLVSSATRAQDTQTQNERMADGLIAGDYIRVHGGIASPVNAQGSLQNWNQGSTFGLQWENWQATSGGVGIVGFGLGADLTMLPLDVSGFRTRFSGGTNGTIDQASASNARILQIGLNTRFRIPSPFAMPTIGIGFGFLDWHPGKIHYHSTQTDNGEISQQHRSGASLSITGGVDKHIYDRFAVFAEASYVYGFTSYGSGLATPTSVCASNGCDILKNTTLGIIRGGLRVRAGR